MAFVEGYSLKKAVFPFSRGKNRISQGVENRGSLISVPLALRVFFCKLSVHFSIHLLLIFCNFVLFQLTVCQSYDW